MEGTLRSAKLLTLVLLLVCTLPSLAAAQQFVCWPIAAGDTASSLARRLTGNAEAAYGLAFQIRDPARRIFVPKSHYQRLQSAWQACVVRGPAPSTPITYAPVVELAAWPAAPGERIEPTAQAFVSAPMNVVREDRWLTGVPRLGTIGAAMLLVGLIFAVTGVPRPIPPSVRRAGENFVTVFSRPLIDPSSGVPAIETRMRFARRKQQLEIFLAPGPGHRYPNLTDHKKNVEYDVARVMGVLGNYVLIDPPRASGKWVVVTISPRRHQSDEVLGIGAQDEVPGVTK